MANDRKTMGHGNLWLFNMEMCCGMQITSLRIKLEKCEATGRANCVVSPNYPAASNEDYLFDCMNLYATLKADGQVVIEGVVFYWNPSDGDTRKSAVIRTFTNISECLAWLRNENAACDEAVNVLNEHC